MTKKILFVANTDLHISLCYLPYMKYLKEKGYDIHVATNTDIIFHYCDKKIKLPISRMPIKLGNIKAISMLRKIINKEKYDLICTSTPMGSVVARIASIKTRKKNNTKLIYTAHGFHFFKGCSIFNWIIYYPIEKLLMHFTDMLITINKEDYNFALKHFKLDTRYIEGIGYDNEKFKNSLNVKEKITLRKKLGITKDDYVILYVAELSKRKRQEYLVKVLSKMNLNQTKVLLVGNNILNNKIYKLIKKKKLEDIVKVLGFRNDISNLLDISDLVISVSKQEGLPLNIMEAMSKGKPIIATDCRGNRDLIKNNVNGILVPIKSEKELIKKINYLKENKDIANKLSKKSKTNIEKYSIDNILPKYAKIYDEILN